MHETSLTFTKDAGEKSVAVDLNAGDELSFTGLSKWMTITTTQEGFNVSVEENNALEARTATFKVLLLKGRSTEDVTVTQAPGGEAYIKVSEEQLKFTHQGGTSRILVDSNTEWSLSTEGEHDWLIIDESESERGAISLVIVANTEITKRVAKIKLAGSGKETIVTVTQKGTMYYDFPFIKMGYIYEGIESERGFLYPNSFSEMYEFELARDSKHTATSNMLYIFTTQSPIFRNIVYFLQNPDGVTMNSVMVAIIESSVDPFVLLDQEPAFGEYIREEGFELAWRDDVTTTVTYWNKDAQVALQLFGQRAIPPHSPNSLTFVHCKVKPNNPNNQTDSYDTYDAVPAFYAEWGATAEQVRAWEEAKGSTFLPTESDGDLLLAFTPDPTKEPDVVERIYYMNKTTTPTSLNRALLLINNMEKALYPTGAIADGFDAYVPSKEYKGLMLAAGFSYIDQMPYAPVWRFTSPSKGIKCSTAIKYFKAEGYIPRLCLDFTPLS